MKRIILLSALVMLMFAVTATAQVKQQLTINGQTVSKAVSRINFDGDNVVLTFGDATNQTADMATVVLGFDYSTTTAISELKGTVGDRLDLAGLQDGTVVAIYDANGKLVATTTAAQTRALLSTATLRSGVYVVKAGNQVVKFIKR